MRAVVLEAVKPLGPDYVTLLARRRRANGWIPLRVRAKRSGAYMNPGAYDVHPICCSPCRELRRHDDLCA